MPQAQVRSQQGERAVRFEHAVRPLLPGLRAAALRLTRNASDADDLIQETVLRAWRFWHHYTAGTNLRAWVHRILRNTFVNRYHRTRREGELTAQLRAMRSLEAVCDAQPEAVPAELSEKLHTGLSALAPQLSAVLRAVAVEELSYREAAQSLGCPIGTVMSRLHRARGALRSHLELGSAQKCA